MFKYKFDQLLWTLNSYCTSNYDIKSNEKFTAIIPSFARARAPNLQTIVQSILRLSCVEKLIVSNHNPELCLKDWIHSIDPRLELVNQPRRRGHGYAWDIAITEKSHYFVIFDDDLFLYSKQIARLFTHLVEAPEVPHGLTGVLDGRLMEDAEAEVDCLFQVFAASRLLVTKYHFYRERLLSGGHLDADSIEFYGDDILLSRAGIAKARIHSTGSLLRCRTNLSPGIAFQTRPEFVEKRKEITQAIDRILNLCI